MIGQLMLMEMAGLSNGLLGETGSGLAKCNSVLARGSTFAAENRVQR